MDSKQFLLNRINEARHTQLRLDQVQFSAPVSNPDNPDQRRVTVTPINMDGAAPPPFYYNFEPINLSSFSVVSGLQSVQQLAGLNDATILAELAGMRLFGAFPIFLDELAVHRISAEAIEIRPAVSSIIYMGSLHIELRPVSSYTVLHLGGLGRKLTTAQQRAAFDDTSVVWSLFEMRTLDGDGRVASIAGRQRIDVNSWHDAPLMSSVLWGEVLAGQFETVKTSLDSPSYGPRKYIDGLFYSNATGPIDVKMRNGGTDEDLVIWEGTLPAGEATRVRIPMLAGVQRLDVLIEGYQQPGQLSLDANILDLFCFEQEIPEYRPLDLSTDLSEEPFNRFRFVGNQRLDTPRELIIEAERSMGIWLDTDRLPAEGTCKLLTLYHDTDNFVELSLRIAEEGVPNIVARIHSLQSGIDNLEMVMSIASMEGPQLIQFSINREFARLQCGVYPASIPMNGQALAAMSAYLRVGGDNGAEFTTNGFFYLPWALSAEDMGFIEQTNINR